MPRRGKINEARDALKQCGGDVTPAAIREWYKREGGEDMQSPCVQFFEDVFRTVEELSDIYKDEPLSDVMDLWLNQFTLMILEPKDSAIKAVMHTALEKQGWQIDEAKYDEASWPNCRCAASLAQAFCFHTAGFLILKGAIDFPPSLDPRPDGSKPSAKKIGRPKGSFGAKRLVLAVPTVESKRPAPSGAAVAAAAAADVAAASARAASAS